MGKKYIIELESGTHIFVLGPEGIVHIGEPDVVYETVDGMQIGNAVINAKPYTEPDLEQVREEAYEEGKKQAKVQAELDVCHDIEKVAKENYKAGLSDAWKAASEIAVIPYDEVEKIFGATGWHIFMKCTASEVIEKLTAYEQKQEKIMVGDEVIPRETECDTMIVTRLWKDGYDSDCIDAIGFDGRISSFLVSRVSKTGKHYEIAAVLEKMRGKQDG